MLSVLTRKSLNNTNIKFSSITTIVSITFYINVQHTSITTILDNCIYYVLHKYTTYIYRHLLHPLQTIEFINLQRNQAFHGY